MLSCLLILCVLLPVFLIDSKSILQKYALRQCQIHFLVTAYGKSLFLWAAAPFYDKNNSACAVERFQKHPTGLPYSQNLHLRDYASVTQPPQTEKIRAARGTIPACSPNPLSKYFSFPVISLFRPKHTLLFLPSKRPPVSSPQKPEPSLRLHGHRQNPPLWGYPFR